MPLYEYVCQECDTEFELLIRGGEKPICPHCESTKLTKLLSVAAGHVSDRSSAGGDMPEGGCGLPQCGMGGCGMGGMMAWLLAAMLGWSAMAVAAEPPARLLVVTVTNGFRHGSIETAEPVIEQIGRESGLFHVDYLRQPTGQPSPPPAPKRADGTSDAEWAAQEAAHAKVQEAFAKASAAWQEGVKNMFAKAFAPETLAEFDGVIFASTTGELPIPDLDGFLTWVKSGKAFIGMHAATDTLASSDAYVAMVGGNFAGHPWNAGGEHAFVVHEPSHPLVSMVPERFRWKDEIYQYDLRYDPESLRVLVSLDMTASTPKEPWHVPVSWVRDYGKGRVFYTNFGHNAETWREPVYQQHLTEGIRWAIGRSEVPSQPNPDVQAAEYLRSVLAAAAEATGKDADELLAKADAKIAADPAVAVGLRPIMLAIRGMDAAARKVAYDEIIKACE
jgi:putative FmdB family regulatory protein